MTRSEFQWKLIGIKVITCHKTRSVLTLMNLDDGFNLQVMNNLQSSMLAQISPLYLMVLH